MDVWAIILGVSLALILVQVAVYRHVRTNREPLVDSEPTGRSKQSTGEEGRRPDARGTPEAAPGWESVAARPRSNPAGVRRCPHCGAENGPDPGYTFCRRCAGRLR